MSYVPWVAIFDKSITTSAQKGYYLVYLFKADMTGVYLSFNQGWTDYKETYSKPSIARVKAQQMARLVRKDLNTIDARLDLLTIDLANGNKDLAKGYENCHICGCYYDLLDMPDEARLQKDLKDLLVPYKEFKGKLRKYHGSYREINLAYLSDQRILKQNSIEVEETDPKLNQMIESENVLMELKLEEPPTTTNIHSQSFNSPGQKTNYVEKQKRQSKLGFLGEKAVLELEKKKLHKIGSKKSPVHISKDKGDREGYDILSYDENGKEIYIEVKTTTKGVEEPFYLSLPELVRMQIHQSQYKIYRLYDFDYKNKKIGKYYVIDGTCLSTLELQPVSFLAGQGKPGQREVEYIRSLTNSIIVNMSDEKQ